MRSSSLISVRHRADIGRTWPYQPATSLLFARVGRPTRGAGNREDRRKGLPRDGQRVEQDRGEEFLIGVERTVRVFPPQRLAGAGLDFAREGQIGAVGGKPLDRALQYVRARIADAVDAVTEAHQPFAAGEGGVDPWLDAL